MEKELGHFLIGNVYGGNQDWMPDPWMKLGGCAALAAVDSCIVLSKYRHVKKICPIDTQHLTESWYITFANRMKPYLSPRPGGVSRMELYTEGFGRYLKECGCNTLKMDTLPMGRPLSEAEEKVKNQIDRGFLVPMLHLLPKTKAAKEYRWHWFLLNGYRMENDVFQVKAVTYGNFEWIALDDLWNEKDENNGGLIIYQILEP